MEVLHISLKGKDISSFVYIFKKATRNGQNADQMFRSFFYLSGCHVFLTLLKAIIKN